MRFSIKWLIAASVTCVAYSSNLWAQASCPADISGRILQNGYSVLTCLPGIPGSGLTDTLAVKDIRSYGTRYANPAERWPTNQDPNTTTIQTWAPVDFDIGGIGPQNVFSVAISPDDGDMYTASTRLWGEPAAAGSIGALLTPGPLGVYRINGTTGAVSLIVNITAINANENFGASYVTYDENTNQVFTVGMDTGTIYRIDPNASGAAALLQSYNPDIDGLIPEDTIGSELVPLGERILGLAWNPGDNRLYYSVWVVDTAIENNGLPNATQNVIRSVALNGANAIDPSTDRLEIAMPFIDVVQEDNLNPPANVTRMANYSNPVADIEFNHDGTRVLLSETGYDSSFPASWAHRSRLLEYTFNGTNWVIVGNQSRYGMGESFFFDPGPPNPPVQYEGINARGGAAWAYESITPPRAVGRDDFLLATSDALILRADLFYGYQFMPTTAPGNVYSSLVADLDGNPLEFAKGLFGDVDVFMCAFDIGNRVWVDANANGIQDGPETGVANVQVTLHTGTNCGNSTGISVNTDAGGLYNIPDILPGQYSLQFSNLPAGAVVTTANQGGDDALDSDANASACIVDFTLTTSDDSLDMGIFFPVDFGDNPDSYGTVTGSTGAAHTMSNTLYLGACVDSEGDGQPSAASDADDGNTGTVTFGTCATAGDDEDGVSNFSTLSPGQNATVDITSTGACVLDAWIDFNQNGNYSDPGEQIFTGTNLVNGANVGLTFAVPAAAMNGTTSSRFRCSGAGGLGATGPAPNGEVEDYQVTVAALFTLGDFVWYDTNQDGIQDVGEPGVNGIDVDLYNNATCSGSPTSSTTTANGGLPAMDGFYEFTGLMTGNYCLEFSNLPPGYAISPADQGGDDALDSDADAGGLIQNINLTADDPDEDVGISLDGSVAGLTWCESDTNANTTYDVGDGDTLLANIQITLYTDANCSNTIDGGDAGTAVTQDTNATGDYLFSNLPVGPSGSPICYLTEVDTADVDLGTCDTPITATLLGPDLDTVTPDSTGNDFGFEENLTLGDFVWYDTNQDGIQNVGEPGVNGVDVALYNNATCSGAAVANTMTANGGIPAADGFYEFTGLSSGSYCVEFTNIPAGYVISPPNQGADDALDSDADASGLIQNINLTADDPNEDMGISLDGSIAGLTWCESDTNANTTYDAGDGDTLLPNVQITLYTDANCSNTIDGADAGSAVTQDTNGTGDYLFVNLPVGPAGSPVCYMTEVDQADTDLGLCNTPITATLLGPDLDTVTPNSIGNDFGFEENLTLGDFVWFDTNQDGIQDLGEPGVNGIAVALYDNATCAGAPVSNTVTANGGIPAADGFYQFPNLSTGMYCVEFTGIPAGYVISPADQGGDDTADSDADAAGLIQNINLAANDPDEDMGISLDGSIAGLTWCESDTNANTTYDAGDGDTLLPNVQITLYTDANCSDTVDGTDAGTAVTQDTNATGDYLFANLPVGPAGSPVCYITEVDQTDTDLGLCNTPITATLLGPDLDTVTPNSIDNNFGFEENITLGDFVWFDTNQDGIQNIGEPGVNGIAVALYDNATCAGAPVSNTVTANGGIPAADGFYQFPNLSTGMYCVEFTGIPAGYVISPANQGGDDTADSDADPSGLIQNINLTANDPDEDMGISLDGSIGGLTWCESDTNANTTYDVADGDTLLPNIQITLYTDANCSDSVDGTDAATAVTQDTNGTGDYLFADLPVGPAGNPVCYITEVDTSDTDLGVCNTAITATLLPPDLDTDTPDSIDNDFGFNESLALGDYVWYDNNQNGQQDAGEPGVNGVAVALYDNATCSGTAVDNTVTANGGNPLTDGYYQFTGLSSGDYCVEFSGLPTGYVFTLQNQGADTSDSDADTNTGQITGITLSQNDFTFDAGVYAAIGQVQGNLFCDDLVPNGVLDTNEAVAGVNVDILRDDTCDGTGDTVINSVDTDANGAFVFTNLPVALAPAPPNPRVCYVVRFDTLDPDLLSCNNPITPIGPQVEVDTDDPQPPDVIFGVISGRPPVMVPVNSWWVLVLMLFGIGLMAQRHVRRHD